jgi:hypothetical protein
MTTSEIISNFELYVDDSTELSVSEELALANKIYKKIFTSRQWEFAKKMASGSISGLEITLPSDFAYLYPNYQYTDNSVGNNGSSSPIVIFIGTNYSPIKVVNFSDRRQYLNSVGYAYIDSRQGKLIFTAQPTETTYEFDYVFIPADLTVSDSPAVPAGFIDDISNAIYHGMAVDDMIIQLFDKAKSYADENKAQYDYYLRSMAFTNANLLMN